MPDRRRAPRLSGFSLVRARHVAAVTTRSIGLIADTHGVLLSDAVDALRRAEVDLILHAGDIGGGDVLERLEEVAPVVAVAGNGDEEVYHRFPWDLQLHVTERRILLCHWYDNYGRLHPRYARIVREWRPDALVYGHTHEARVERRDGVLFLNPGYAGPPEQGRRRSVATLDLGSLEAHVHPL